MVRALNNLGFISVKVPSPSVKATSCYCKISESLLDSPRLLIGPIVSLHKTTQSVSIYVPIRFGPFLTTTYTTNCCFS